MVDFLSQFLNKSQQQIQPERPLNEQEIEQTANILEQPSQKVEGFISLPELDMRENLANSLMQTANDATQHPLTRGLTAYLGSKQLRDISSERAKTMRGLQDIEQQRQQKALEESRAFDLQKQTMGIDAQKTLQSQRLESQASLQDERLAAQRASQREQLAFQRQQAAQARAQQERMLNLKAREAAFDREAKALEREAKEGKEADKQTFDRSSKLRSEYTNLSKNYVGQRDAYGKIKELGKLKTGAAGTGLIYAYMKLNDPTSQVTEGEIATTENAAGVSAKIRNAYNKMLTGDPLPEKLRREILQTSDKVFESAQRQHDKRTKTYTGLAEKVGADPEQVILDFNLAEEQAQSEPAQPQMRSFGSVADVEAANLPIGTEVMINGRRAIIE